MADKPQFKPPTVEAADLQTVADQAFGTWLTVSGGDVEQSHGRRTIVLPEIGTRIQVVVHAEDGYSCFPDSSLAFLSSQVPKTRYSWKEVTPVRCGQWETRPYGSGGRVGDARTSPAYEVDDREVEDGSHQEIELHIVWYDETIHQWVQEWRFRAGGGVGGFNALFGPYCIQVRSSEVCCDATAGFYSEPFYEIYGPDGVIVFEGRDYRADAILYHQFLGRDGCMQGECPSTSAAFLADDYGGYTTNGYDPYGVDPGGWEA